MYGNGFEANKEKQSIIVAACKKKNSIIYVKFHFVSLSEDVTLFTNEVIKYLLYWRMEQIQGGGRGLARKRISNSPPTPHCFGRAGATHPNLLLNLKTQ